MRKFHGRSNTGTNNDIDELRQLHFRKNRIHYTKLLVKQRVISDYYGVDKRFA